MAVTCQHCGTEAPDDRVMCPNCGRRLRPAGEQATASPTTETATTEGTTAETGSPYDAAPPTDPGYAAPPSAPWGAPAAPSAGPPRPQVLFARTTTVKSNRLTVAFRLILAIPHIIVLYALNFALEVIGLISWFAALFTAEVPQGLHDFMVGIIGWQTRVAAYVALLTDRYPPFALTPDSYDVTYSTTKERFNRAAVFFRFFLALPAFLLLELMFFGYVLVGIVTWFIVLISGRMPAALFDANAGVVRYLARVQSFFWLVTPAYPAGLFKEEPTGYGTEAENAAPQPPRQTSAAKRLIVTFIVIGALGAASLFSVAAVAGAKQAHNLNELRRAHDRVVAVDRRAQQCGPGDLNCVHTVGSQQAASFRAFERKLESLDLPSSANGEKAVLELTTRTLIGAFDQIAAAPSIAQLQQMTQTNNIVQLEQQWNRDYQQLDDAVVSP